MPRPRTITDDALLAIARRCFLARGHAIPTREIAAAAGISQAILYQRFGDKEALFLRAMTPAAPDPDLLLGPTHDVPAHVYLREALKAITRYLTDALPALLHLETYPGLEHTPDLLSPIEVALTARVRALADTGAIAPASPEATARALTSMAQGLAMRQTLDAELDASLDAMFGVLWYGLQPRF